MLNDEQLQNVSGVVASAQTILVMLGTNYQLDQLATATSLFLTLEKMGKKVTLLSPVSADQKYDDLAGVQYLTDKVGNQNLHVIFDYDPQAIDKVSYHINEDTQKFYLVVQPQKGHKPLDSKSVEFDYGGAEADLIFLVGVNSLEDLVQLYFGYESLYQDSATISINNFESQVANINLDLSSYSCMSEGLIDLIESWNAEITHDVATNLLAGIEEKTDSFLSLTTTEKTFAAASQLLKNGARRIRRKKAQAQLFTQPSKKDNQNFVEVMNNKNQQNKSGEKSKQNSSNSSGKQFSDKNKRKKAKNPQAQSSKVDRSQPGGLGYQPNQNAPSGN